jgi:phosphate transport system permease protein
VEASTPTAGQQISAIGRHSRRLSDRIGDRALHGLTGLAALGALVLMGLLVYKVVDGAWPSIEEFGISFLWTDAWNPVTNDFGALAFIYGTLWTAGLALLVAGPIAIAIGLWLSELAPRGVRGLIGSLVEMLAAIPSVVLGLWGILVLGPVIKDTIGPFLSSILGWTPFFNGTPEVSGYISAVIVLTIMIVPITASISRELFVQVPQDLKEGALGLGLTRWEMVRGVMLPFTRGGLVAAMLLGMGRAIGEAIAVTQVIGATAHITVDLFATGDTLASRIAAQYAGATTELQIASLFYLAVILLAISLITNVIAQLIVTRFAVERR